MKHEYLLEATKSPTYRNSRTLEHPYSVIRAILNLHRPELWLGDDEEGGTIQAYFCTSCSDTEYPCSTIEAISEELNA